MVEFVNDGWGVVLAGRKFQVQRQSPGRDVALEELGVVVVEQADINARLALRINSGIVLPAEAAIAGKGSEVPASLSIEMPQNASILARDLERLAETQSGRQSHSP